MSHLVTPVYVDRYLFVTAPAQAAVFEDVPWARMDARPGDAIVFGQSSYGAYRITGLTD